MDTGFVDLDILLTRIRQAQSKVYFLDAVKAYKAGALRASLTAAWVALVYDLIAKYRELSAQGDAAATTFIQSWDAATAAHDVRRLLQLEATIIEDATVNTQIVNRIAQTHLERLREDRNFCAHPAFFAEAELFEPSPELVRLHLVNAVDLVLSREPLQGKAIFDLFDVDVQSTGFPTAHAKILDYVEQRYLASACVRRTSGILAGCWRNRCSRARRRNGCPSTTRSFLLWVAVRDRAAPSWPDVALAIVRLIDNLERNRWRRRSPCSRSPTFGRARSSCMEPPGTGVDRRRTSVTSSRRSPGGSAADNTTICSTQSSRTAKIGTLPIHPACC